MKHLDASSLGSLVASLQRRGYRVLGPVARDGAVVYAEISGAADLPRGVECEQEPGRQRCRSGGSAHRFPTGPAAQGWKRFLLPPSSTLWSARRARSGVAVRLPAVDADPCAFLGVRPCDAAAIGILDRAVSGLPREDPAFRARRDRTLVIVVQCTAAAATCFCDSTGTGPQAAGDFDIAMTEVLEGGRHYFLAEAGTVAGAAVLDDLESREALPEEHAAGERAIERARRAIVRRLEPSGRLRTLGQRPEHPRWDEVARRCLACGSCTSVCPTCFCTTIEDRTGIDADATERRRVWDSCFTLEFSHVHGGSIRSSIRARYRQWLTHKLCTWIEQFGTPGCVGCGRCIAWCPAGIDLTEEVREIVGSVGPDDRVAAGRAVR